MTVRLNGPVGPHWNPHDRCDRCKGASGDAEDPSRQVNHGGDGGHVASATALALGAAAQASACDEDSLASVSCDPIPQQAINVGESGHRDGVLRRLEQDALSYRDTSSNVGAVSVSRSDTVGSTIRPLGGIME